jgi:hypothetical protein
MGREGSASGADRCLAPATPSSGSVSAPCQAPFFVRAVFRGGRTRLSHGHGRSHCQDNESLLQSALFRGSIERLLCPLSSDLRSAASRTLSPKSMHRTKGPHSLPVTCSVLLDETHGFPWFSLGHLERFLLSSSFHELRVATWRPCAPTAPCVSRWFTTFALQQINFLF